MATRRYEYVDDRSSKFWEVEVAGTTVTTRWGRIGTAGQTKSKDHATAAAAERDATSQIRKKTSKGYVEAGTSAPTPVVVAATTLEDGGELPWKSTSGRTYTLKRSGDVFSCSCPAWLHQSEPIERRTCKHLRAFRGDAAEEARLGALPARATSPSTTGGPPVLLAESWEGQDPTGWWMSEKLDGVRAWWDGTRFLSRRGNEFVAPPWFTAALPDHPLDGELFGGRRQFQTTISIARSANSREWDRLRFVVFDVPEHDGPFAERLDHARGLALGDHAEVLDHTRCEGEDHLKAELARVEALGGEGLMLRQPGSRYAAGRSTSLLKVKSFYDAEGIVVGHEPGRGRHAGRLGALRVALRDGTEFKVGTGFSDAERADPPAVGAVITFRYQELTRAGVPRFASFVRVRDDDA